MTEKRGNEKREKKDPENGTLPMIPDKHFTRLALKYEDILLLVKDEIINIPELKRILQLPKRTIYNRVKRLTDLGLLDWIPNTHPRHLILTQSGFQYLEIHSAKSLERIREGEVPKGIVVTQKTKRRDSVPFDIVPFLECFREYLQNLPSGYPTDPLFFVKAHWIRYKFKILSIDRYLTNFGLNEFGLLAKQTWCNAIRMKNHFYYQGTREFHNSKYFIQFTTKHVIIRFPVVFAQEPMEAFERILQMIFDVKRELEDRYSTHRAKLLLSSLDPDYVTHCIGQHYGIQLTPLSIICNELGIALEDEKKRVRIDASKGIPETEFISRGFGIDDALFGFKDLVWQVVNEYGVENAYNDIQLNAIKHENQYQVLSDKQDLSDQKANVLESILTQTAMLQANQSKLSSDFAFQTTSQIEQLEERLASFTLIKRSVSEQRILTFLQQNQGVTRNEISTSIHLKLSSVCGYIAKMKKAHLIREEKVKKQRGKLFLNTL